MTDAPAELLRLASADNLRDVAGDDPGYPTRDGRHVRRGAYYRSNELQLTQEDARSLAGLRIQVIHDLRGGPEIEAHPDVEVAGAAWRHAEVAGIPMETVATLADVEAAHRVMHEVYVAFVRSPAARSSYAALLTELATGGLPQLFHCTAGKDRTGWAAALLLELAGVDHDTIVADYLLTNEVSSATREKYLALVAEHLGSDKVAVYEPTMVVEASYLQAAYDAAAADYGSVDGYLRDGLGLGDDVLAELRARLVV
ncbi:tyrosine-protein phosphatase [Nocardioides sp. T2.26MG-1]|uniref:tyrosine-protein phosphatase n=1 Tax=Nocardioides sp. T2.26MG-1 TaxID=3041166 RepID=UPI0024778798|nr:tyrosine-protein phosphatase [Nocardioides sp. T2.26MG-1]CAI9411461.1 Tyrosine-protein phosphatase [Nocardioides sp. T2.26MG-1]